MPIKGWICPECGATKFYMKTFKLDKGSYLSVGSSEGEMCEAESKVEFCECAGCSRIFGDPLKFNKNKL